MKTVDELGEIAAFARASCRIRGAIDHEGGNINGLPLLAQTQIANLLHIGRGHACITLDHFAALFVELAYFLRGFMSDEEMKCANGVSAHFRVDLIERRANESALATHIFETIFEPTSPNSLSCDEPPHGLLRQDHRCDERAKAMGEDEHASGIHESVALQGA